MRVTGRRRSGSQRVLVGVVVAIAALSLAACSSSDDTSAPRTEAGTAPGSTPAVAAPGVAEQLQFAAPLVGGGEFDGTSIAGQPTAFWFWAPT